MFAACPLSLDFAPEQLWSHRNQNTKAPCDNTKWPHSRGTYVWMWSRATLGVRGVVTQLAGQFWRLSRIRAHRPGSKSGAGIICRTRRKRDIIKLTHPEHLTVFKGAAVASPNAAFDVLTCGDALISALQRVASYSKIKVNYGAGRSWRRTSCKAEPNVMWRECGRVTLEGRWVRILVFGSYQRLSRGETQTAASQAAARVLLIGLFKVDVKRCRDFQDFGTFNSGFQFWPDDAKQEVE